MASTKYHVRSISFPSRSHPSVASVEEQLGKLKELEVSSAPSNSNSLCIALTMLEDLYGRVDSLLNMGSTQQVLSQNQHDKHTDTLLEASVRLLDVCGLTRDVLLQTNEHVRELQCALRRRRRNKGDSSLEASFSSYVCFRKKAKKDIKKFVSTLKQVDKKFEEIIVFTDDDHFFAVMRALRQACETSVSVFQSLLSFLAVSDKSKHSNKSTRWSLVASKFAHKGRVIACEDEKSQVQYSCVNEFHSVDSLISIVISNNGDAQRRLEALETSIDGLESGLESVFRRLIKTRASLLNIISH